MFPCSTLLLHGTLCHVVWKVEGVPWSTQRLHRTTMDLESTDHSTRLTDPPMTTSPAPVYSCLTSWTNQCHSEEFETEMEREWKKGKAFKRCESRRLEDRRMHSDTREKISL